uniref:hypothetical protein n=1 Tax=Rhodospora sordida TaxID=362230 RepID=UPI001FCD1A46|nr:hypothetical protein MW557_pgp186 [Rhodospora sordida]UNJ14908.1 hypothetical protein [Rhodospora sordida]
MNNFPIIYLVIIVILFTLLAYILTAQIVFIYKENQQINFWRVQSPADLSSNEEIFAISQICWRRQIYLNALIYSKNILSNKFQYGEKQISKIFFQLGKLYSSLKCYDQTIFNYNSSLEIEPNSAQVMLELARTFQRVKQYSLALQTYNKIIKLYPNNRLAEKEVSRLPYVK